jgi:hypothetical protein
MKRSGFWCATRAEAEKLNAAVAAHLKELGDGT